MRYVYIVTSPLGYHKVGHSRDINQRLSILSIAHPEILILHKAWPHEKALAIERETHKLLQSSRANGEWFKCNISLVETCVEVAINRVEAPTPEWNRKPRIVRMRKPRRLVKEPKIPTPKPWTAERLRIIRLAYESGTPIAQLNEMVNDQPGAVLSKEQIRLKAHYLGLRRPEGYVDDVCKNGNLHPRWTPERDAYLTTAYPAGEFPENILKALNEMSGITIDDWNIVRDHAKGPMRLRRPEGFNRALAIHLFNSDKDQWDRSNVK
jgi:hypothetical protein